VTLSVAVLAGVAYLAWFRERPGAAPATSMIAVLPFENLSGDPAQDFFSDGFTEELIGQLGRTSPSRLGVISPTSTLAYRNTRKSAAQIGRELGVQHLVEGTVRRSGDRVRINAQLIRVSDQSHVWAEIYEGNVRDILAIQQEVGNAIARQVVATLAPRRAAAPRAVDPAVYDLYLRGRFHWNRRIPAELQKAAAAFTEAVRLDPTFAPAFAGLADSLLVASRPASLAAAEKAVALDNRLAEAHSAKAQALKHMLRWAEADESFREAIALDPSYVPARYFYAEYLMVRGQCQQAIEQARQALAFDPLSAIATHIVGVTLYYCRDYDGALPYLRKALELDAGHYWSHFRIGLVLEQQRSYGAALAEFERTPARLRAAYTYASAGRMDAARQIVRDALADPQRELSAYQIASAYVGLGDHDEALRWFSLAVRNQSMDVIFLSADPRLDPIRTRPEFQALLRAGGWMPHP
jgi:TolB-like protein/tetratricopeptide (TPR) repeat protein